MFRSIALIVPALIGAVAALPAAGGGERVRGAVLDAAGTPIVGAFVTATRGDPARHVTVWSDERGHFQLELPPGDAPVTVRARRIGWHDLRLEDRALEDGQWLRLELARATDPATVAAQLPANHWYDLVLRRLDDPVEREQVLRQCTFCHQQGNRATRLERDEEEWRKILLLMGRRGGMLPAGLREKLPGILIEAYEPENAIPVLTAGMDEPGFAPPPPPEVRRAVIDEWDLGGRNSMQHDMMVHPDGRIYSVDMSQDQLYRLDPATGEREAWTIPHGDLPLGGVFAAAGGPPNTNSNAHVGPHSLQVAPDGSVWITLALGNRLAGFDPDTESFEIVELEHGYYPHTLRFDGRGRIWYTISASNHLGMWDPARDEGVELRLPARTLGQAIATRMMPFALWLGRTFDLRGAAAEGDGFLPPVPYGIDVAPDGSVWFSQLNEHRIGRVDPDSLEIRMVETPFDGPRRMRFDAEGRLWIPGFSSGLVASFDPATDEFREYPLPIEPLGSETPYALAVHPDTGDVWICGTNSDTLIRLEPASGDFTVYPLPTRVTYTREIDFDAQGRVWTSNSNSPAWQIEGGMPRVLRLDPRDDAAASVARSADPAPGR